MLPQWRRQSLEPLALVLVAGLVHQTVLMIVLAVETESVMDTTTAEMMVSMREHERDHLLVVAKLMDAVMVFVMVAKMAGMMGAMIPMEFVTAQ